MGDGMIDVVVVGGSLAGAATATHLAAAGHQVLILERSTEDRGKPCGEGLFPRGVAELDRLGLLEAVRASAAELSGLRFYAGSNTAEASLGSHGRRGLGVRRDVLDPLLRERVGQAGAELRRDVSVSELVQRDGHIAGVLTDRGETVSARVIVGADGVGSRLRRQAGLDRPLRPDRYGVSAHVHLAEAPAPFVEVHFRRGLQFYVTPVGGRTANVAVLAPRAAMTRFAGGLAPAFERLLKSELPFSGFELIDAPRAAGPFPAASTTPWRENLVLVGDAAGFVDPISGEGMSTALVSAADAATAIGSYLQDGNERAFVGYARRRRRAVRNADLLARLSLALSSRQWLAERTVRNLARHPETFARLTAVNAGDLGLRDLRLRDALALTVGL